MDSISTMYSSKNSISDMYWTFKYFIDPNSFDEQEVTEIWLKKCYLGLGVPSAVASIPTKIVFGSTVKHHWIVLKIKLGETKR